MTGYSPKPEHKFTFGLWTVGNRGADPFGSAVRGSRSPAELVYLLGEAGAYGVNSTTDRSAIASRGLKYEKLDQLTNEVLLGVR